MNSRTKKGIFQEVKDQIKIEDVAAKFESKLTQHTHGKLVGTCPTGHKSNSGTSFTIDTELQLCHCFNCGLGGDVFLIVEKVENKTRWESLLWLIKEFNLKIDLPRFAVKPQTPEEIAKENSIKIKTKLYKELIKWGKELLHDKNSNDQEALVCYDYLTRDRGYDPEKLLDTDFSYIPNTKLAKDYLLGEFPEYKDEIHDLKIAGGRFGDKMKINLPYKLADGTITGLVKRHQSPKGINNGLNNDGKIQWKRWDATKGLKKNDLYGIQGIKKLKPTSVIIVEGYPDSEYMQALGLPVLAIGSALPNASMLDCLANMKNLKAVTISLDNDETGLENTKEALDILSKRSNLIVNVLPAESLGNEKDLDEFLRKHGKEETKKLLATNSNLGIFWFIDHEKEKNYGTFPNGKISEVIELIALSTKSIRGLVLSNIKDYLGITPSYLTKEITAIEEKRWVNLYQLDSFANPLKHWPKIPFVHSSGYGVYDRAKEVPDPAQLGEQDLRDLKSFDRLLLSNQGKKHVEDLVRGKIDIPPILPTLEPTYDPIDMYEIDHKRSLINTFVPTKWMHYEKTNEIIGTSEFSTIYGFIEHLVGTTNQMQPHKIINWLSTIFNTKRKVRTSLILVGAQGAGKNIFVDYIIKYLFGIPNVSIVGDTELNNPWTDYLSRKMFIVYNELSALKEKQKSAQVKLKGLISDPTFSKNEKYISTQPEVAWFNLIFISNYMAPVAIDHDDRRFIVIKVPDVKLENSDFFKIRGWSKKTFFKFREAIEEEFPRFVQYIKNLEYDKEDANEPVSNDAKFNMIKDNNTIFVRFAKLLCDRDYEEIKFLQMDGLSCTEKDPYPWEEAHMAEGIIECNQALNIVNQMTSNFSQRVNMGSLTNRMMEQGIEKTRIRRDCSWKIGVKDNRTHFFITPSSPEHSRFDKASVNKKDTEQSDKKEK